jgi:putative ABC transport system permease protein
VFDVTGVLDTGDPIRDASLALAGRETLQNLLSLGESVHEWAVTIHDPENARAFAAGMNDRFDGAEVMPWNRFLPQLNDLLGLTKVVKYIVALIFYFAVILVTINTMYMALMERMHEFAVMNAVGLGRKRLSVMVVLEALFMSLIAAAGGGIVGTIAGLRLQIHPIDLSRFMGSITYAESIIQPRIRSWMTPDIVLIPVCMLVLFGAVVALFPAFRLLRMRVVSVLREV